MLGLTLLVAWLALTVVLPVLAALRAARAARTAEALQRQLARLESDVASLRAVLADGGRAAEATSEARATHTPGMPTEEEAPTATPATAAGPLPTAPVETAPIEPMSIESAPIPPVVPPSVPLDTSTPAAGPGAPGPPPIAVPLSLEDRIGSRWFLYVGVATLVLGASYFVKYAFENDWVTPAMRVALGAAGGLALMETGRRSSRRGQALFGQMLTGGGIAVLYVSIYAALSFYNLISPTTAFTLMALTTGLAAGRADAERAQGLALLAVAGGFATPFLVGGGPTSQHVLFGYDAVLVAGTLWLARRHAWPALHLVSVSSVTVTMAAWMATSYVPTRWLPTELWLTLFTALFVAIRQTVPSEPALWHRVTRVVLGATPLVYHAISLQILWRHTVGLLVYLIAVTAVGVTAAGLSRRAWLRLATWLLVALPALAWLSARPARWDSAPLVALFGIYALHLVSQMREGLGRGAPPPLEVLLLHANGLWLWAGLALFLEKIALARLGLVTFALAGWHLVLAAGWFRSHREVAWHTVALAGALVAAGVAIELDGAAVTIAWATEGAAIVLLGLTFRRGWLRIGGGVLLTLAVVRLVQELLAPAAAGSMTLLNLRSFTTAFVTGLLGVLGWQYASRRQVGETEARAFDAVVLGASVLVLLWATAEVSAWFDRRAWTGQQGGGAGAVTAADFARQVTLSLLWAGYGALLVAVGIRKRYQPLRVLAIALLGLVVVKVFLVDLSRLDRFYRMVSTVGLGLLLLGASYLYQRKRGRDSVSP